MIKNMLVFLLAMSLFISSCKKVYSPSYDPDVVINEIMPLNSSVAADQDGEFDDWIELFNKTGEPFDLSGFYLSDSGKKPAKWKFPAGTSIQPFGFLIVWADQDTTQKGLHANFSLSAEGEKVYLLNRELGITDEVEFSSQALQLSWSRVPDGTGTFRWQTPTFMFSNILP